MQERSPSLRLAPVRRMWIYLLLGLSVALQFALQGSISLMVPQLKADVGCDEAQIGLLSSLFFFPYVLLQVPSGYLLSSIGRVRLLLFSSLLMAVGCLVQSYAYNLQVMMAGRFLMGVGAAPIIVCFLRTIELLFPARLFGALAAGMEGFGMLGAALGDVLLPTWIDQWGWHGAFKMMALLSLIPLLGAFSLPTQQPDGETQKPESSDKGDWQSVLRNSDIWSIALYSGLVFSVVNAFGALWAIPFLEAVPHLDGNAGLMASCLFVGTALGAPVLGWLVDHSWSGRRTMISFGFLTVILLFVVLSGRLSAFFYYPAMFLLGACAAAYMVPFVLLRHWFSGKKLAVGLALVNSVCVMVGSLVFQPLIGVLLGLSSQVDIASYRVVLAMLPVGVILGCVLVMSLPFRAGGAPSPVPVRDSVESS